MRQLHVNFEAFSFYQTCADFLTNLNKGYLIILPPLKMP